MTARELLEAYDRARQLEAAKDAKLARVAFLQDQLHAAIDDATRTAERWREATEQFLTHAERLP